MFCSHSVGMIAFLSVATILLISTSVLVMAEEFQQFPTALQKISSTLVHNRRSRTAFICGVIVLMACASSASLMFGKPAFTCFKKAQTVATVTETAMFRRNNINPMPNININFTLIVNNVFQNHNTSNFFDDDCVDNNCTSVAVITSSTERKITRSDGNNSDIAKSLQLYVVDNESKNLIGNKSDLQPQVDPPRRKDDFYLCMHAGYVVFTWVLSLIALATALKLYYLIKTFLAVVLVTVYAVLIMVFFNDVFKEDKCIRSSGMEFIPLSAQMIILLTVFFVIVAYHARLVEVTSRLDFLWKLQAEKELADMQETRHNNTQLLKNILPDHVAQHFLSNERNADVNLNDMLKYVLFGLIIVCFRSYIRNIDKRLASSLLVYRILRSFTRRISIKAWNAYVCSMRSLVSACLCHQIYNLMIVMCSS